MNVPGVTAEELGGVILRSRNPEAVVATQSPPLVGCNTTSRLRRAALCRADQLRSKRMPSPTRYVSACPHATGARNEGTACAVVHSLRVGAQPDGLREPVILAGVPAAYSRSAAVVRVATLVAQLQCGVRCRACLEQRARQPRGAGDLRSRASIRGIPLARTPFGHGDSRAAPSIGAADSDVTSGVPAGRVEMRVAIGSDHAGFELKETLKASSPGSTTRCSTWARIAREPVDYPDYAEAVGAALREHRADRGIIVCGSGVGASMAANRIPGIRAGLCHDTYSAHQGVEHDDMNVLVLGGRVVGIELARELVRAFLERRVHAARTPTSAPPRQGDGARESRCARCRSSASRSGSTTSGAA